LFRPHTHTQWTKRVAHKLAEMIFRLAAKLTIYYASCMSKSIV